MKSRIAFVLAALSTLGVAACASGGAGQGGGGNDQTVPTREEQEFEPGAEPSDNMHTRSADLYLDRARSQTDPEAKRERFRQALEAARESIQQDPGNPKGFFQAAKAQIGLGDYAAADSMFDRAEEIYPRYRVETEQARNQAWVRLYNPGINALQQGNLEEAKEFLEKADQIYRGRPEALLNLGAIYAQSGEVENAIESYRNALGVLRGEAFERQDEQTQEQWAKNRRIASFNLAQLLAQNGQYAEAEGAYREYIENNPDNIQAMTNLAVVLVNQDKQDQAAEIYDRLLARDDLEHQDYFNVGIGLFQTQKFARAAEAFRKSVELNPYSRDANYNLAQALFQTEQFGPLLSVVERLLEQDPYNRNALAMYTQALLHDGQEEKAQEMYDKHEDLPLELTGMNLRSQDGGATLSGQVRNLGAQQGQTVEFRFSFLSQNGESLAEKEVQVELAPQDEVVPFQLAVQTEEPVVGYSYERIDGGS